MKPIVLFASICIASGILLVNIYTSIVDVRSWQSNVPASIETAREYFKVSDPGNFFRIFSPINQLLGLMTLLLFWRSFPSVRLYLGAAFILYVLAEGLTFKFFYPRNDLLFKNALLSDIDLLKKTVSEWAQMNWIRSMIILTGISFSFLSLHKIYLLRLK